MRNCYLPKRIAQFRMRAWKFTYISYLFWNFIERPASSPLASRGGDVPGKSILRIGANSATGVSRLIREIGVSRRLIRGGIFSPRAPSSPSNEMSFANSATCWRACSSASSSLSLPLVKTCTTLFIRSPRRFDIEFSWSRRRRGISTVVVASKFGSSTLPDVPTTARRGKWGRPASIFARRIFYTAVARSRGKRERAKEIRALLPFRPARRVKRRNPRAWATWFIGMAGRIDRPSLLRPPK